MSEASSTTRWRGGLTGLLTPLSHADFTPDVAARTAGLLFVTSGAITAATAVLPHPAGLFIPGVLAVGVLAALLGALMFAVPRGWWTPRSIYVLVPLANVLIGLHNYWGADPYRYAVFYIVAFAWLGFALPPGSSLKIVWTVPFSYLLPMWASGDATAANVTSLVYVVPLCVLIAESIAWVVAQVRRMEGDLERARGRAALADLELRTRHLIERIPAISYVAKRVPGGEPDWAFTYVSPQLREIAGADPAEWIADARAWERGLHPDDRAWVLALDDEADRTNWPMHAEYRFVTGDGRTIWLQESSELVPGPRSDDATWQGAFIDITAIKEAEERAREANERHQSLVERLPGIAYIEALDHGSAEWRYTYVSPQVQPMLGYTPAEWLADPLHFDRLVHPDDLAATVAADLESEQSGEPFRAEYRVIARDGRVVWVLDEATLVYDEAGQPRFWHGIILDITARKLAEQRSREREAEFQLLFSQNPLPTWVFDQETHAFLEVNDIAIRHYGYTRDEFLAMHCADLLPSTGHGYAECPTGFGEHRTMRNRLRDGRLIDVEITTHQLEFRGRPAVLVIAHDVTARNAMQAQLAHQAFHDALTGLPNRALFTDRVDHALRRSADVAVLFVDLDDFKRVNDTLGHGAGDLLLVRAAERLAACIRPRDTIARLGGDEFTILLEECTPAEAERVADRLADALAAPIRIDGHDLVLSPSIGIALGEPDGGRTEELLRRADVAMYDAKHRGKSRYSIFQAEMDESARERLALESELRRAIHAGELRLHYQPILALASSVVAEVEALVRWEHPERGLLYPSDFIPLAEETGLIAQLGRWVLDEACRQAAAWSREPGRPPVTVAINLSARQFQGPGIVQEVADAIAAAGVEPGRIKLEITETVAMSDIAGASSTLRALKALGVQLAVDDFGAGYSGMSYLLRSPIDAVKIDRSYVREIAASEADRRTVQAMLAFARTLRLDVVAEGVETAEQLLTLRDLGVQRGQGFLFARPLPPEELDVHLGVPLPALALA